MKTKNSFRNIFLGIIIGSLIVSTYSCSGKSPTQTTSTDDITAVPIIPELYGPWLGQELPGQEPRLFAPGFISLPDSIDYSCTFSPDGQECYFTRRTGDLQKIMETHQENGRWTTPAPVAFSEGFSAHEPHLSPDGNTIYFGWFRPLPEGEPAAVEQVGVYYAERTIDGWSQAQYCGQAMAVSSTQDGSLYGTNTEGRPPYVGTLLMQNKRIVKVEPLTGGVQRARASLGGIAHPALAPDGSYIVFDRFGEEMYVSFKDSNGTWGEAKALSLIGLPNDGGIASISPDGRFLFYQHSGDIYWVSTEELQSLNI